MIEDHYLPPPRLPEASVEPFVSHLDFNPAHALPALPSAPLPPVTTLRPNALLPKLNALNFPSVDPPFAPSQTTTLSPPPPTTPQSAGAGFEPIPFSQQIVNVTPAPAAPSPVYSQPIFSQPAISYVSQQQQQAPLQTSAFSQPTLTTQAPVQTYLAPTELRESTVVSQATLASHATIPTFPETNAPVTSAVVASSVTVSPQSGARPYESPICVSPISTSNGPNDGYTVPPTRSAPPERSSRIDDSLIARLRGFSERVDGREPRIRDTTESLAGMVGGDNSSERGEAGLLERPHSCRKCSASFRRRDNLMAHIRAQHKGERPFKCEVCGFRFIKKDHAMKHWKVVHLKERPFVCSRCNSRFGQRSDLNKHVRSVHLRIKPFECEHCGLRFSHRGNQIRHQAVVHEKRKPYVCSECDSSFAEKSNLLKHCQAVHKNVGLVQRREL